MIYNTYKLEEVSPRPTMEAIITPTHPVPWTVQGRRVTMVMVDAHECVSGMLLASHSTWPEWILTWVLQLCQQIMVKHLFRYKVLHTCELAPSVR